jgi:hypothetical protein
MPTMIRPTPQAIAETADEDRSRYFQADPEHQLVADPSRRQEVTFASDGLSLAGHLYRPPNVGEQERTAGGADARAGVQRQGADPAALRRAAV